MLKSNFSVSISVLFPGLAVQKQRQISQTLDPDILKHLCKNVLTRFHHTRISGSLDLCPLYTSFCLKNHPDQAGFSTSTNACAGKCRVTSSAQLKDPSLPFYCESQFLGLFFYVNLKHANALLLIKVLLL